MPTYYLIGARECNWGGVIAKLSKSDIHCKFFVGWRNELADLRKALPRTCRVESVQDCWTGIPFQGPSESSKSYAEDLLKRKPFEAHEATIMMNRLDPLRTARSAQTRLDFFQGMLAGVYEYMRHNTPDLVVFPAIPHRVFDYSIALVADDLGVKYVYFVNTPVANAAVAYSSLALNSSPVLPAKIDTTLDKRFEREMLKWAKVAASTDYSLAKPSYMNREPLPRSSIAIAQRLIGLLRAGLSGGRHVNAYWQRSWSIETPPNWRSYEVALIKLKGTLHLNALKEGYQKLATSADFSGRFAVLFLHYQPEATTSPQACGYSETLQLVREIVDSIPNDCRLLIKEHPTMFQKISEGFCSREMEDYYALRDVAPSRIQFIPIEQDNFELVDAAWLVITCTGTVGAEAVCRNKPVLITGNVWYVGAPGVISIDQLRDLRSAAEPFNTTSKGQAKVTPTMLSHGRCIEKWISGLSAFVVHGNIYSPGFMEAAIRESSDHELAKFISQFF